MRLIDADLANEYIKNYFKGAVTDGKKQLDPVDTSCDIVGIINMMQTAKMLHDNTEKHGAWYETDAYPHRVFCSLCFSTYIYNRDWIKEGHITIGQYCPHCGAKMDEVTT